MMWVRRQPAFEQLLKSQRSYGNHRFGVTAIIASGLRQSSLRGYGNRRFGVTTNIASGLRQTSQRSYDEWRFGAHRHSCSLTP
ncbi:hypothetical protein J5A70_01660 [Prevotella nigrescens]|uniref:hypothetical protein n=1 Tax=Prevotella nigrescens TaxID=28133 RepID=UPI001BACCBBE|nr:hypothetical protein [Prevotella nigrescens]QUB49467.1 hypothetical protein J5A70_01660 [Prevotella nigrescens]